ncbi:MAG: beta-ketoacyl synthase N-terminal-like domain-containing protein [Bacteroidales bacterium]|nr:beta-ketoacyl synthase N-terminal-like domain-containing protein [Bacteroidales bacterium]
MKRIWITGDALVTPLGFSSGENFANLLQGKSGLKKITLPVSGFSTWASFLSESQLKMLEEMTLPVFETRFEKLLFLPLKQVIEECDIDTESSKTLFMFATTKGNIELVGNENVRSDQLSLFASASKINRHFGNPNKPLVISNACISGLAVQITAMKFLENGEYDTVIIAGADTVNPFILEGFNSLLALSPETCRPFDRDRQGINIGEGGAAMVLSTINPENGTNNLVEIKGGAITNDANHISGPSRTGLELAKAADLAMNQSGLLPGDIDFVSAHGTATLYNDEMEAKALTISGLSGKPTHSLKGYFGHTLGVAGLIESIICIHSLRNNVIIASKGFENTGTPDHINIITQNLHQPVSTCIKTMAGFGGCNAAICFSKS